MAVDHELAPDRVGVKTRDRSQRITPEPREVRRDVALIHRSDLGLSRWVLTAVGCRRLVVGLRRHLHAATGTIDRGQAIEAAQVDKAVRLITQIPDEDRHVTELLVSLAD